MTTDVDFQRMEKAVQKAGEMVQRLGPMLQLRTDMAWGNLSSSIEEQLRQALSEVQRLRDHVSHEDQRTQSVGAQTNEQYHLNETIAEETRPELQQLKNESSAHHQEVGGLQERTRHLDEREANLNTKQREYDEHKGALALERERTLNTLAEQTKHDREKLGLNVKAQQQESGRLQERKANLNAEIVNFEEKRDNHLAQDDATLQREIQGAAGSLEGEIAGVRKALETQRGAVDAFLKYCSASLAQSSSWSHLLVASAGVGTSSRFNQPFTSSASLTLPWVLESLKGLVDAVAASPPGSKIPDLSSVFITDSGRLTILHENCRASSAADISNLPIIVIVADKLDLERLCIVLLQGIAYVHLAMEVSPSDITWNPEPRAMLDSLSTIPRRGSMLDMIYRRVYQLVYREIEITSWFVVDELADMQLDSSNSALPEDLVLTYSLGNYFLVRATGNREEIYVIDSQIAKIEIRSLDKIELHLPSIDGLPDDLRVIQLMHGDQHASVIDWYKNTP